MTLLSLVTTQTACIITQIRKTSKIIPYFSVPFVAMEMLVAVQPFPVICTAGDVLLYVASREDTSQHLQPAKQEQEPKVQKYIL
jgi:hypothetical protein